MSEQADKVFEVDYADKATLYNCYMGHTVDGGIFVPSTTEVSLGDVVMLAVTVPERGDPFFISGKVVWINTGRRKGFGVRLSLDDSSRALHVAIQNLLGGALKSGKPTYTV